ncbi:MAG: alpha-amylase [Chryseobacterium sp.]|nr:alpha-amylase [Chryseobacterium sp.]
MIQFFHWYSDRDGVLWKHAEKEAKHLSEMESHQFGFRPLTKVQMEDIM